MADRHHYAVSFPDTKTPPSSRQIVTASLSSDAAIESALYLSLAYAYFYRL
ncbi:unnamed protein product [Periconia digitata]|uniref:Uncharacterized protein n=1 Tax=Periconia digitata TaxID=1303443 RepID=A0A9W4XUM3_9PLEO|nr:unnamed protein product [Periconia digitata]